MVVFPNCKINIGLNIIKRRTDGFHNIETIFYPVPWTDILEMIPSNQEEFTFEGNKIDCPLEDNLCYRAYQLLKNDFNIPPINLYLYKIIPAGAGLGGGSSDAAFTLTTLNQLFSLNIKEDALMHYASMLGSDCAFFLRNKPAYATGKGNIFKNAEVNLDGYYLLIVKPQIHITTAHAYKMISPEISKSSLNNAISLPIMDWKTNIKNDFEAPLFNIYPQLQLIKQKLYELGAVYAAMSGSGSAIYGLLAEKVDFNKEFPDSICWMNKL
jgi:4-diphosphocytidyl-2-C-methyl-D-erythritol kinase